MIASEGGRKADRRVGREEGREIKIKWGSDIIKKSGSGRKEDTKAWGSENKGGG